LLYARTRNMTYDHMLQQQTLNEIWEVHSIGF
jgi:hypothetical protein